MSEIDKQPEATVNAVEASVTAASDAVPGSGVSRRRLMRAGLSAAPVMLALKSQSVLAAGNCISPSAFSSLQAAAAANTKLSHTPNLTSCARYSLAEWQNPNSNYPSPYTNKSQSYFLGIPAKAPRGAVTAGFVWNPGGAYTGKTLQDVVGTQGNGTNNALAGYVVAAFLTAVANGDNPTKVLLTTAQCKAIWEGKGYWSPAPNINWTLANTLAFFDYIYAP